MLQKVRVEREKKAKNNAGRIYPISVCFCVNFKLINNYFAPSESKVKRIFFNVFNFIIQKINRNLFIFICLSAGASFPARSENSSTSFIKKLHTPSSISLLNCTVDALVQC